MRAAFLFLFVAFLAAESKAELPTKSCQNKTEHEETSFRFEETIDDYLVEYRDLAHRGNLMAGFFTRGQGMGSNHHLTMRFPKVIPGVQLRPTCHFLESHPLMFTCPAIWNPERTKVSIKQLPIGTVSGDPGASAGQVELEFVTVQMHSQWEEVQALSIKEELVSVKQFRITMDFRSGMTEGNVFGSIVFPVDKCKAE